MDVCRFSSLVIGLKTEVLSNVRVFCTACLNSSLALFFFIVGAVLNCAVHSLFFFIRWLLQRFVRAYIIMICI